MRATLLLITTILLATACSPQKRLARLLRNHPQLVKDTVITDTFTIAKFNHDTTLLLSNCDSNTTDTFYIETPRFTQVITRKGKKLNVDTEVKDTTGIKTTHLKLVPYEVKGKCKKNYLHIIIAFVLGIIITQFVNLISGMRK